MNKKPIGVFDSGVGGLTVVKEILKQMPQENIIYFADTLHLPYGERNLEEVKFFALKIMEYLTSLGAKAIIMGCNISSAVALEEAKKKFKIPVFGLIEGGAETALKNSKNKRIGIIATSGTVKSNIYQNKLKEKNVKIFAHPCPEFVLLVEENKGNSEKAKKISQKYLKPLLSENIDTLILGCTHYSYLVDTLKNIMGDGIIIIDPAIQTVRKAKKILEKKKIINSPSNKSYLKFIVSGNYGNFKKLGGKFLKKEIINIEKNNIFE